MQCEAPVFTIFTGDAKTMKFRVCYANTYLPFDLTNCTAISVFLPKNDGTVVELTIGAGVTITSPAVLGQFAAAIDAATSALLNIGELQNVDVTFTVSGSPMSVRYYGALSVLEAA